MSVLCLLTTSLSLPLPDSIGTHAQIADLACGANVTLVLTNAGKVLMFGDAKDISLERFRTPKWIQSLPKFDPIVAIAMTAHQAFALSDTGSMYRWTAQDIDLDSEDTMEPFHAIKGV